MERCFCILLLGVLVLSVPAQAQRIQMLDSAEIQIGLEKLNVLGSVLYIAAHPDDENTSALAYFSQGRKYRTAYLSLTRGDGGQNLIGSERGSEIGIIRTQELLAARGVDGAEQYFTRAVDFGYSKTPEESLEFWGKDAVLADVVWVIRSFRPDVILTRFPIDRPSGHGHHTASASLAREAFVAAGDPSRFPEQLDQVEPWQAKRLLWNGWRLSEQEQEEAARIDIGEFDPLLGASYSEIAATSRSMHKSQGFGSAGRRGTRNEYFKLIEGSLPDKELFTGIDTSWARVPNGSGLGEKLREIADSFDPQNPPGSLPLLLKAYSEMDSLEQTGWVSVKKAELLRVIQACAGLWMEAISTDFAASPGDVVTVNTTLVSRTDVPFELLEVSFPKIASPTAQNFVLENNKAHTVESNMRIPSEIEITQPYWLRERSAYGLFNVSEQALRGAAENTPSVQAKISLSCLGNEIEYLIPVLFRWRDRVDGELYRQFEVRPKVTVQIENGTRVFTSDIPQDIRVRVKANTSNISGSLRLSGTSNWQVNPPNVPFSFSEKYEEAEVVFQVTPPGDADEALLRAEADIDGETFSRALVEISHPHIKRQVYFPESTLKVVKLTVKRSGERIGYVMGSGDEVVGGLRNLGYEVTLLSDEVLESGDLGHFDAIITGIRAYNTRERLKVVQPRLLQYVEGGGTLIVQYNVSRGLVTEDIGPYPFKLGRDRVSEEDAPVTVLAPDHVLLNAPNKITQEDFKGWVQERGLYFASEWDEKYETVIVSHDSNESEKAGSLIYARYGEGVFIYSGISWFRQLPAGVPGAYRIFANLISVGKENGN
ncbi:MAG: PIG-L family deacetylase [bacterium]|nr:PIG-L family deacetylase [bacterium]